MNPPAFDLSGSTAVVTGAKGLLGKHHCIALADAGASVIAIDLPSGEGWPGIAELSGTLGQRHMGVDADITSPESLTHVRDMILAHYGRLDVLVNNAALNPRTPGSRCTTWSDGNTPCGSMSPERSCAARNWEA